MSELLLATDPRRSFSVLASAGTGKTWQLVARLTRLLLDGACIDNMLAITFTRKAAGEMQQRMTEQLLELLDADDNNLDKMLEAIGETPDQGVRNHARSLLEQWLRNERPLRTLTFHSFCQELLQRFPLEADLPPGFELAEQTGLLIQESWDALFNDATRKPDSALAQALEYLFESLDGLHNTRSALFDFVEHRGDWWAFIHGRKDPAATANALLEELIKLDPQVNTENFWNDTRRQKLQAFAALLQKHSSSKKNIAHAGQIHTLLERLATPEQAIAELQSIFFTKTGSRLARKESKAQKKSMGEDGEQQFLELHHEFCEQLEAILEQQARQLTLASNRAWCLAGQRMLEHFQRIKRERRLLDFTDLEWNTYQLLNHPDHTHWIQFKLDQSIDHLLIDEFQDTNPVQWRLILPLLEEMAAGDSERKRSLFIVGDAKQSIYRFRRGNPRLLGFAAEWMHEHLQASSLHLDQSWRSSPAVLEFVNRVFASPAMQGTMEGFLQHSTHKQNLWGRVEIWPMFEKQENETHEFEGELRNPLKVPRATDTDRPYYREGEAIAQRIAELIGQRVVVGEGSKAHPLGYDDVLVLLRTRTHLSDYEDALRGNRIPYLSLDRGTLLQSLEIRDLEALLRLLITPQDNLALAQVLRSPIFSASDEDLMSLARQHEGSWMERIRKLGNSHPLHPAQQLLDSWHALAGRIPIHDLLERIFHESNLVARYQSAFPETQAARVQANLSRFVELALEVDGGRYPTLPRFLDRLGQLRTLEKEGPSQATPAGDSSGRVRLLTVHGSKGLEAPLVFVADAGNPGSSPPGYKTLVRWPAENDRPSDFLLLSKTAKRDSVTKAAYEQEQKEEQREAANLLYVALTRAQHMLVISACESGRRGSSGWYEQIVEAVCDGKAPEECWTHVIGTPDQSPDSRIADDVETPDIDPRLQLPVPTRPHFLQIAPSREDDDAEIQGGDGIGKIRGLAIHRFLQLSCEQHTAGILRRVAGELQWNQKDARIESWWQEASNLFNNPSFAWIFEPGTESRQFNEVPIQYEHRGKTVYGIIDRLVKTPTGVHIIDYKTHRATSDDDLQSLAVNYRKQLNYYRKGIEKIWPGETVRCYLLFSFTMRLLEVEQLPDACEPNS